MIAVNNIDVTGYEQGVAGFIRELHLNSALVVKQEAGALIQSLVRLTPPKHVAATRKAIDARVDSRFEKAKLAADNSSGFDGGNIGLASTGVKWYAVTSQALYGVADDRDMRTASVGELKKVFYTLTPKGRQKFSFKHPRKKQKVIIAQNVLTDPERLKGLKAQLKLSIGRLKAAWLVSWAAGVIKITGGLPQYVTRHMNGARGRFIDGTANKDNPTFSIGNSAMGVQGKDVRGIVQLAVGIRAKAMVKNLSLFMEGKKHFWNYAKS